MARKIATSTLNASTIDIINVIRANAPYEYQNAVPEVSKATDIPRVGEIIMGTPALANNFINSLVNRIALVTVKAATFNNPYVGLKKGYLEFGETVEEIFVNIAKPMYYDPEKAPAREFKRSIPDIRSTFHVMNWRVLYPVTVQDDDLRMAFLSADGVTSLISRIVETVYKAAEYDEFLLFKYLLIKGIANGDIRGLHSTDADISNNSAIEFRTTANQFQFLNRNFNSAHVLTNTPMERLRIFMTAEANAKYDVNVLAGAFNMDKADFIGRLTLIDDFGSFDNERFNAIREQSDALEVVTTAELEKASTVQAIMIDSDWFQVYDNLAKFTEKFVASGDYWNYFYHTWKTISYSPYANAVAWGSAFSETDPSELYAYIDGYDVTNTGEVVMKVKASTDANGTDYKSVYEFVQDEAMTTAGIAVTKYGAYIVPADKATTNWNVTIKLSNGSVYSAQGAAINSLNAKSSLKLTKQ